MGNKVWFQVRGAQGENILDGLTAFEFYGSPSS